MKKNYLIFLTLFFISIYGYTQQEPQFSQYMFNNLGINPAYAGMNGQICANLFHRQQWVGFEGRPVTTLITADNFFKAIHGGIGLTVLQETIAQFNDLNANLTYAYHISDVGAGKLSLGLQAGFKNKKIDFSKFRPIDESDPILLNKDNLSAMAIDLGFGIFYQEKDKFYAGLSASQLMGSKEEFANKSTFDLARHYYLTGGYHYSLEKHGLSGFILTP